MDDYKQLRHWIEALPKTGRSTFSLAEAREMFPSKPPAQVKNALNRLTAVGRIVSVWRGYYAIVLPEYGVKGIVPPIEYIDHLMGHLNKDYYVATLSAAAIHGASHQKPFAFTFICDRILHTKKKNGVWLEPLLRKRIPHEYVERKNVRSGTVNISSPILTAVDLMLYPLRSGGYGNIATVISELSESIDLSRLGSGFFEFAPVSAIQRLGYLLDEASGASALADELLEKALLASVRFRKTPLATYRSGANGGMQYNEKWKIIVNEEIEVDI